ncbi:MAG: pilus assembly protein PilM [Planctomycetota bacterium]
MPPVEQKRIPELVKLEAVQQIPFDINDVQWDWQLMSGAGSAESRVGIFAIKNEVVDSVLEHFNRERLRVAYVQMAPMALYNYAVYDRPELAESENHAIIVLDVGAENTDLVVCTRSVVWQRCIHLGGNAFTRAIADAFKLSFQKAEKLKRTAPMSKYARQIFQAMRPVYTDLASEVQRSLSFYTSSNPDTKLLKTIAVGGGTKMRGLLKYLRQTLQIPVERPDSFVKLQIGSGVSAAKFHENASDFGVVYGLALQGLGLAEIDSNLLPRSIARSMAWASKAKYFTVAASMLLVVSLLCFARASFDRVSYSSNNDFRAKVGDIVGQAQKASTQLRNEEGKGGGFKDRIEKAFKPLAYRDILPRLYQTIVITLPNAENNPEQAELYEAFAAGEVEKVMQTDRRQRKQVFITGMAVHFVDDIEIAKLDTTSLVLSKKESDSSDLDDEREMAELEAMGGVAPRYARKTYDTPGQAEAEQTKAGFVVMIEGYSPYKDIYQLFDPPGVENDPAGWGVITRLMRLNDIVDGNSIFELYKKDDPTQFNMRADILDVDAEHPPGIGISDKIASVQNNSRSGQSSEDVLRDPMTKEIISKVAERQDGDVVYDLMNNIIYKENDSWFVLKFKLVWKNAPELPGADMAGAGRGANTQQI